MTGVALSTVDFIPARYVLEVSSPGIERELYSIDDFVKFTGRLAKIKTRTAVNDQKTFVGSIESVEGDKITIHVDMSSNEIYTGANQDQTRFFRMEGNRLILRTPEIASAVRPGQKAVGTITFERER